ncbi:MAG: DUF2238 domain-containing protein [Novosphingobium sp.]|nr:DUF2238 domain-containing protein [Novosphingobium sp.]
MLGAIALGVPLSIWGALYPGNTWLQVGPVLVVLLLAIPLLRRWPVSNPAASCICAFLLLHMVGARWSYSFVPYDDWFNGLLGISLGELMGWQRNMFDRLVHLIFGGLAMPVLVEIAARHARLPKGTSLIFALLLVLGLSSLYEVFEWSLTMALAPEDAGAYNGEQGDPYDSQKDMAWAALGALLMLPVASRHAKRFINGSAAERTIGND